MGGRVTTARPGMSAAQRAALGRLASSLPDSAYLAGGVAAAIRCGHRISVDLDLFTPEDPTVTSLPAIERLEGVVVTHKEPRTLYLEIDGIPISILSYAYPHLRPPERIADLPVPIASVEDLVTMKLAAIVDRGAARDFWDLHELMRTQALSLEAVLALHQRRFPRHDIGHVVRALVYFADAEAAPLPAAMTGERWETIKADFRAWVRAYAAR